MYKSVYSAITQYEEVGGNMVDRIKSMGLNEVFGPIISEYGEDMEVFNQVLFFIVHCYSRESEYHIQNADWEQIKKKVAEHVGLDPESRLYADLFYIRTSEIALVLRQYMDYQGGKALKHLVMLKDLYVQMVNAAIENITDKEGNILWDQKVKNADHADRLYEKIQAWEQRIENDEVKLNKPRTQLNEVIKANKFSLRMEDNME